MVFADWTLSTQSQSGGFACQGGNLDLTTKYSGASSLRLIANRYHSAWSKAVHNIFSEAQAQLILWIYTQRYAYVEPIVNISSYGSITCTTSADGVWNRFRLSFWYDVGSNIKWGRTERWDGSNWVQIGSDTNFGENAPASGQLTLISHGKGDINPCYSCWFDEVEVYS